MEEFLVEFIVFFIIAAILIRVIRFPMGKWRVASFIGMLLASLFYLISTAFLWMALQKPMRQIFKIDIMLTLLVGGISFALLFWDILRRQKVMMEGKKGIAEFQNALKLTFISPEYWIMFILYFVSWIAIGLISNIVMVKFPVYIPDSFYIFSFMVVIIGVILYRFIVSLYGRQAVKMGVITKEENIWSNRTVIACFRNKKQSDDKE